jgi:predicted transcriptional regulator
LLEDGHWHDLEEIIKGSKLNKTQVDNILEFLANYNFIDLDSNRRKVKLTPSLKKFLKEEQSAKKQLNPLSPQQHS